MKKFGLMLLLAMAFTMLMVPSAFAITYVHGNFATNSQGCASCHVTHAAVQGNLLKFGNANDQASFCFACHSWGGGSPYDAEGGATLKVGFDVDTYITTGWNDKTNINPSYTGGFDFSWNFADNFEAARTAAADTVALMLAFDPSTSKHNVEGLTGQVTMASIPGGTVSGTGNFRCGSCHNPHQGGPTPPNPRLLNTSMLGSSGLAVTMDIFDEAGGDNRVVSYGTGINAWCGACHNIFASAGAGSGSTAAKATTNPKGKFMHAMNVVVNPTGIDTTMGVGTPLNGTNNLHCLSCHRAHGTAAVMSGNATGFVRYGGGPNATGSALLRSDNRDVCYNCHGAAERNTPAS